MGKSLIWRWLLIVVIVGGWTYSIFPPTDRDFYVVLREEASKAEPRPDEEFEALVAKARELKTQSEFEMADLNAVEEAAESMGLQLSNYISLHGMTAPDNEEVLKYVRRQARGKFRLGLDLKGGTEFIIAFSEDDLDDLEVDRSNEDVRDQIIEIIRNRVDQVGVLEPEILPIGPTSIAVRIPTIDQQDVLHFRNILLRTAKLNFHMVHPENQELVQEEREKQAQDPAFTLNVPGYTRKIHEVEDNGRKTREVLFINTIAEQVNGTHLQNAHEDIDRFGNYQVSLIFDSEGAKLFGQTTTRHVGERMAIVLDDTVYSAPNINEPITQGSASISGNFSLDEARQLAIVLKSGNLPVDIQIEGENSTSPTLGKESIRSATYAAIAGILIVMVFMIIYYFLSGIVADIALVLNMILVMGTLPILDATLTLPGMAGIILTIGMAVDANVLIFERIREESKTGKSIANAIKRGYASAFSTILDANLTTLFTAFILIRFGSGPIKGFGVTLSVGILASMFTALFVTRVVFDSLLRLDMIKNAKMLQLFETKEIPFVRYQRAGLIFSAVLAVIALATFAVRGPNAMSVDFRGGTALTYRYQERVAPQEVIQALEAFQHDEITLNNPRAHYKASMVKNTELIEIVVTNTFPPTMEPASMIMNHLNESFPDAQFSEGTTDRVGALVGKRFTMQAINAVIGALIMIILYITFRFEFSYALGAVAALVHDVIIGTGIFLLCNFGERQISLTIIAGLLTIIGYSLNDTIVVFDRIRENVGLLKGKRFRDIINISINQTLSRTVLTSVTTFVVVATLYLFGGGAINDFALIMLIGIIIGTYSSVFVATPVMYAWQMRQAAKHGKRTEESKDPAEKKKQVEQEA